MTTNTQSLAALDLANQYRIERARIKKAVKSGEVPIIDLIVDPPPAVRTMTVHKLLMAQAGWGKQRATAACRDVAITDTKTLGGLTDRQRQVVAGALGPKGSARRAAA